MPLRPRGKRQSSSTKSGSSGESGTQRSKKKKNFDVVDAIIADLHAEYTEASDQKYAASAKKYMRGQFDYFGLRMPAQRKISNAVCKNYHELTSDEMKSLLKKCWSKEEREFQYFACDMAKTYTRTTIRCSDVNEKETLKWVQVIKELITTKSWWDTVDILAPHVIGAFVSLHPTLMKPMMDEWIESENMWLRRSAILHQLTFNEHTDQETLFRFCSQQSHETEFFIQKSIGWALRQYHRTDPKAVQQYVIKNKSKMAKLSVREALKHAGKTKANI